MPASPLVPSPRVPLRKRAVLAVGISAGLLFSLPMALLLFRFRLDAPFYFLAEDSFYYLSIALHSAHVPFFSLDGLHPTNGFHPLWEWCLYSLSKWPAFPLDGPSVLARYFAVDLGIVAVAVALLSAYLYRLTRQRWISILAICPGFLWLLIGIGAPSYMNPWAWVNGMETGVELLSFALVLHLFGSSFRLGGRFVLATIALGGMVLSRLDDIFFLLAFAAVAVIRGPRAERTRRLAAFALPALMIAGYLLYNQHSLGVWLPVSGMAKAGKGYRAGIGESLRLLRGWPFFAMAPNAVAFGYSNVFVMVAQMLVPMAIAGARLVRSLRNNVSQSALVPDAMALGVLLKGSYNFLRVPVGYQGSWYYGASIATADILLALFASDMLRRLSATDPKNLGESHPSQFSKKLLPVAAAAALMCLTFISFNIVASRATENGFATSRDTWLERTHIAQAIRSATDAPFLEFQDGELSFGTGLPAISGFGLAADPASVRAQHNGTFFTLLAQRGVTVAAASNLYPQAIAGSAQTKSIYPVWGFNAREIQNYCFQPFWYDPHGNIVLYRILHQPVCPAETAAGGGKATSTPTGL